MTELTRVNPDRNIFSINVKLTSTFLLYRGLVPSPSPNFKNIINFRFLGPKGQNNDKHFQILPAVDVFVMQVLN